MSAPLSFLLICFLAVFAVLAIIFLVVPLLRGIGWMIGGIFNGIGWLIRHVFEFIGGVLGDIVRFAGAIVAWIVLTPIMLFSVIIGRWSAAGHYWRSMRRECTVGTQCLYRVVLQRPLRFLLLGGLLEGLEERVNEAVEAAPTADKPRRRTGRFDGYTIVGSLPGGGSGAKLYIAEPDETRLAKQPDFPDRVVIKSFAITDGSSLPQIVRESRALEAAKQLGLVLEHGMDEQRFFYVMPYHHGDHLGIITRQLHAESDGRGLDRRQLGIVNGYLQDLLETLARYHEGGLWHKDVKPDNIIVHDGRAHLVDLGLVTPLRSAMTLTTHGTEYFRDPEMVRMALKGVKVHQVDGAKFDIYAVGAVLYFVVENTFPAHGGLSTFSKSSPEALRWVIRRAMADYGKRYETARQMLADVVFVADARDPFALKPADLPSMRGAGAPEPAERAEVVAAAGSPVPPPGVARGPEGPGQFVLGAAPGPDTPAVEPPAPDIPRRPEIRVTNWWTGAYEVVDPGAARAEAAREARAFRHEVHGLREQSASLRRQLRYGARSARRAAKEQIREARTRAREMQRRARAHRHRAAVAKPDLQPSGMMAFLALAVIAGVTLVGYRLSQSSRPRPAAEVLAMQLPDSLGEAGISGPLSLLLINDHPAATNDLVQSKIDRIIKLHRDQGWEVVMSDDDAEVEVRKLLPAGEIDPDYASPLLRHTLRDLDFGGIIRVRAFPGEGDPADRVEAVMIALPEAEDAPLVKLKIPVGR